MIGDIFYEQSGLVLRVGDLPELVGARASFVDQPDQQITGVTALNLPARGAAAFAEGKGISAVRKAQDFACLLVDKALQERLQGAELEGKNILLVDHPRHELFRLAGRFLHLKPRDDSLLRRVGMAYVAQTAQIGKQVRLGAHSVVHDGAKIGDHTEMSEGCVIGPHVHIGANCHLDPHVSIEHTLAGEGCFIGASACIGHAGFGFSKTSAGVCRLAHYGAVRLEEEVEIGALVTVARGALEDTKIAAFSKIDDHCHIAHNVQIGTNTHIAGTTIFAGSVRVGKNVKIGGLSAIANGKTIGDGASLMGGSTVIGNVPPDQVWGNYIPAMPRDVWTKYLIGIRRSLRNG